MLTGGAAIAQLFTVRTGRNYAYHTTASSSFPGPPAARRAARAYAAGAPRPDWARRRSSSAVQAFNVAAYTLAVLVAYAGVALTRDLVADGPVQMAAAGAVAMTPSSPSRRSSRRRWSRSCAAARCARRASSASTASRPSSSSPPSASASRSSGSRTPWLVPFALAPLLIVHRSLASRCSRRRHASTRRRASSTPVTSTRRSRASSARANASCRPLAVLMADLDLLREVNNTHGHLAGDAVLRRSRRCSTTSCASTTCRRGSAARSSRSCCPETGVEEAAEVAERIRGRRVPRRDRRHGAGTDPRDRVDRPRDLPDARRVADRPRAPGRPRRIRAKVQGRNRVVVAGDESIVPAEETPQHRLCRSRSRSG